MFGCFFHSLHHQHQQHQPHRIPTNNLRNAIFTMFFLHGFCFGLHHAEIDAKIHQLVSDKYSTVNYVGRKKSLEAGWCRTRPSVFCCEFWLRIGAVGKGFGWFFSPLTSQRTVFMTNLSYLSYLLVLLWWTDCPQPVIIVDFVGQTRSLEVGCYGTKLFAHFVNSGGARVHAVRIWFWVLSAVKSHFRWNAFTQQQ